jgi:hypothetical protein
MYGVSTTGNGPVCIGKVKISISDVVTLEGVGARLWAGNRKGFIYAYDVTGGELLSAADRDHEDVKAMETTGDEVDVLSRPWVVTNVWRAHGELPVTQLAVDPFSVFKVSCLLSHSFGHSIGEDLTNCALL